MPGNKKRAKKPPNIADLIKAVQLLSSNENNLDGEPTTVDAIVKNFCKKSTFASFIKKRPYLPKNLIETAVAQGKIFPIKSSLPISLDDNDDDVVVYRTPKTIQQNELSKIIQYNGDIPGSAYFQLLKIGSTIESTNNRAAASCSSSDDIKQKGFTTVEWIRSLHKDSRFLNYSHDFFRNKLIPIGLKHGHIRIIEKTPLFVRLTLEERFHQHYQMFRRNRVTALQFFNSEDLSKGLDQTNDMIDTKFVDVIDVDDDDDGDDGDFDNDNSSDLNDNTNNTNEISTEEILADDVDDDDSISIINITDSGTIETTATDTKTTSTATTATKNNIVKLTMDSFQNIIIESEVDKSKDPPVPVDQTETSSNTVKAAAKGSKTSPTSAPSPAQPQRVSQRKKIKKSLGPDFVESDTLMLYTHQQLMKMSRQSAVSVSKNNNTTAVPSIVCFICGQPYRYFQKFSYPISCSMCGSKAHGTCFRSYIGQSQNTKWICTGCKPDSICFMCQLVERKPEFYVACKNCSTPYHAHCWREKAHAVCQKCRCNIQKISYKKIGFKGKPTILTSTSPSTSTPNKVIIQNIFPNTSTNTTTTNNNKTNTITKEEPVVTIPFHDNEPSSSSNFVPKLTTISTIGNKVISRTNSLLKATIITNPTVIVGTTTSSPSSSSIATSGEKSLTTSDGNNDITSNNKDNNNDDDDDDDKNNNNNNNNNNNKVKESVQEQSIVDEEKQDDKKSDQSISSPSVQVKEEPLEEMMEEMVEIPQPKIEENSNNETSNKTIAMSTRSSSSSSSSSSSQPPHVQSSPTPAAPVSAPEATEASVAAEETKGAVKTSSVETDKTSAPLTKPTPLSTTNVIMAPRKFLRKRKKELTPFEVWAKRPTKSVCYNFKAWLESELTFCCKRFGPDVDLKPLSALPDHIPDWSSENVYLFFSTLGFKDEAAVLLEKDVDGLTMMLMNRQDFLYNFPIKTGPAIKLFGIVTRLHEELAKNCRF